MEVDAVDEPIIADVHQRDLWADYSGLHLEHREKVDLADLVQGSRQDLLPWFADELGQPIVDAKVSEIAIDDLEPYQCGATDRLQFLIPSPGGGVRWLRNVGVLHLAHRECHPFRKTCTRLTPPERMGATYTFAHLPEAQVESNA